MFSHFNKTQAVIGDDDDASASAAGAAALHTNVTEWCEIGVIGSMGAPESFCTFRQFTPSQLILSLSLVSPLCVSPNWLSLRGLRCDSSEKGNGPRRIAQRADRGRFHRILSCHHRLQLQLQLMMMAAFHGWQCFFNCISLPFVNIANANGFMNINYPVYSAASATTVGIQRAFRRASRAFVDIVEIY